MATITLVSGVGLAYALGSIPTGYWLGKAVRGIDVRQHGSGNIGASNVGRVIGKPWGMGVLIFDILKGTLAVGLGQMIFYSPGAAISLDLYKILCGAAAVCGHNWSLFLGFCGGKGVATSAGVLLGIAPVLLAASAVIWLAAARIFGYISVASIAAAIGFSGLTFFFPTSFEIKIFGLVMAVILIFKHRGNIRRLLEGTEPKIGRGEKAAGTGKGKDAVR